MLNLVLIVMVIFAILAIQTKILRRSVIYLTVFSLLCSFAYLLFQAPDVAIAEAVIACTLSTVLFLVALRKYTIFRVYYIIPEPGEQVDYISKKEFMDELSDFLYGMELELDLIETNLSVEEINEHHAYDMIVENINNAVVLSGSSANYHYVEIATHMIDDMHFDIYYHYTKENMGDVE